MEGTANIVGEPDALTSAARFVCASLDFAPCGFAVVKLDGTCITANRTLATWVRPARSAEALSGASLLEGDDGSVLRALRRAALGESVVLEVQRAPFVAHAGPWRLHVMPFRLGPTVRGATVVFEDRAEEAMSAEAFAASERRFRLMVDGASYGVAVHGRNVLLYVNPVAARILRYDSADEMVGRPILDFVHPDCHESVRARLKELQSTGSLPLREQTFLRKDGSAIAVEVAACRGPLDDNVGSFVFFRDVSERKRLQADLLRVSRLELLGRIEGQLVQQIDGLLGGIQNSLASARGQPSDPSGALSAADAAVQRAVQVTRQLMTLRREAEEVVVEPAAAAAPPTVLICDDEARLARLTAELLEQHGYPAFTVVCAEQALDTLEVAPRIGALLLDVNASTACARTVLDRMHEKKLSVPVILTSGYAEEDVPEDLMSDSLVSSYLPKPFAVEDLVAAIGAALSARSQTSAAGSG